MKIADINLETLDLGDNTSLDESLKKIEKLEEKRKQITSREKKEKEELLTNLALIRDEKKRILDMEKNKCIRMFSKISLDILETIIPYTTNLEPNTSLEDDAFKITDAMVITEIKVGAYQIRKNRDNEALFAFLNGNWQALIEQGEICNISNLADEILKKITSESSGKSLFDLKQEAMELGAYYNYLQIVLGTLCLKYGHDWQLKYVGGGILPSDIGVSANYVCKLCNAKMQEVFSNADDIDNLPSLEKRWEQCDPNMELPAFDICSLNDKKNLKRVLKPVGKKKLN